MTKVKNENFQAKKKLKLQILSYRRDIYPKRKLRTCTIQIQPEKVFFLVEIQFPKMNMVPLPFYGAKVLFSEGRGRM